MKIYKSMEFRAERAWGSASLMDMAEHHVRIHWTDQPYRWHTNSGDEVFVVLHGEVEMHFGDEGDERIARLRTGDTAVIPSGERHVACPVGEARILVVERRDTE